MTKGDGGAAGRDVYREIEEAALALATDPHWGDQGPAGAVGNRFARALDARPRNAGDLTGTSRALRAAVRRVADPEARRVAHSRLTSFMFMLTQSFGNAEDMSGLLGLWTDVPGAPGQPRQSDLGTGVVAAWLPHTGRFLGDVRFGRCELLLMMRFLAGAHGEESASPELRRQVVAVFPGMLSAWFGRQGEVTADDLTGVIDVLEPLTGELPPDEEPTHVLMTLLSSYHAERGRRSGLREHADLAVESYARAAGLAGPRLRAHLRGSLGAVERDRYLMFGERADLDASLKHLGESRAEGGEEDPQRQVTDYLLVRGLLERAHLDGRAEDVVLAMEIAPTSQVFGGGRGTPLPRAVLDELPSAVAAATEAAVMGLDPHCDEDVRTLARLWDATEGWTVRSGDRAAGPLLGPLHWQARIAFHRFSRTRATADHDHCTAACRAALARTEGELARAQLQGELAVVLLKGYEHTGAVTHLDESIAAQRAHLAAADDSLRRGQARSNLSSALMLRAEATGSHEDLDASVAAMRDALAAVAEHDPHEPSRLPLAVNLVSKLIVRYERLGTLSDLAEAVDVGEAAVAEVRAADPEEVAYDTAEYLGLALSNLGGARRFRFEALQSGEDLDAALEALRGAVAAVPPEHPDHSRYLFNLGSCLSVAHRSGRDALEEAVERQRAAVSATAVDHPGRARRVASFAGTLVESWLRTGEERMADEALSLLRQIHDDPKSPAEDRLCASYALAGALRQIGLHDGDEAALREAVRLSAEVARASTASAVRRITCAGQSALLTERLDGAEAALPAWEHTVELLSQVAWRGLLRTDQEHSLADRRGVAAGAAACALDAGVGRRAVEFLEQGRSVLWTQLLEARAETTLLDRADPALAAELRAAGAALEAATAGEAWEGPEGPVRHPAVDQRVLLGRRWDALVERATEALGGESPFAGVSYDELAEAAAGGPVVLVNLAPRRCDALVVRHGQREPLVVPLAGLRLEDAAERARRFRDTMHGLEVPRVPAESYVRAQMVLAGTLGWLWESVVRPVLDALDMGVPPAADAGSGTGRADHGQAERPRVWWCPTGPLTLLPLHAAGPGDAGADDGSLRRTDPSYTPTVRGLLRARTRAARPVAPEGSGGRVLAVAVPSAPGLLPLEHAADEAAAVATALADRLGMAATTLEGEDATRERVQEGLTHCSWAHFACHGGREADIPSSSALHLYDGPLTVLDVARQRLAHAELAFLSACRTAVGDATLYDEALHVSAGLQLAGFREVVGTLWPVTDDHAVEVARRFYGALGKGTGPARAIAETAEHMRRRFPLEPVRWAGYPHFGP